MDSGNSSGSMQSSSGGDEEYDSRAESSSISAFLNNQPSQNNNVGPFLNSHPLQPQHHHNNTLMFDPLSNYLDPIQRITPSLPQPNSLPNLDIMWSKPARSEPNPTDLGSLMPCSSSPSPQNQAFLSTQLSGNNTATFLPTHHTLPSVSASRATNNDQTHNTNTNTNNNNPKKRSRASRRAPTTVLTTDTTNFRAMVQEFTGIPAPPFTSSPFQRSRLDLFASAATSTVRSTHLDPSTPPYLLRPFAQKLRNLHPFPPSTSSVPPSFLPSSSMVDTLLPSSNNPANSTNNSTSINYQLSSSSGDNLGLLKQPLNNFNMQNPVLNFQNILQAPQKYSLGNYSKTQLPSLEIQPSAADSHIKMGVFEELGLRHDNVNTDVRCLHQNTVSVGVGALSSGNNNLSNASTEWAQITGTITNNDCDNGGGGALRSLSGTISYSNVAERVTNGKVHYSASSSDFQGEKGPDCTVAARSQGMVESWINCSTD